MLKNFTVKKLIRFVQEDPADNIEKAYDFLEKFYPKLAGYSQFQFLRPMVKDPNNNWHILMDHVFEDIDPGVIDAFFQNFVINGFVDWAPKKDALDKKYDCNIPWTMLIDPTTACNLACDGCWAAQYDDHLNLRFEELDDIIRQGKELGMHVFLFSGGEPLVRKDDVIRLCEKHDDCFFLAFTNGTLIDDAFAEEMLRVKNFVPAISVEGFEAATDSRRGSGTFAQIERAMDILKAHHLPFGVSCAYTSQNTEAIASEEYFDFMVEKGALFAWFFTFMPVGVGSPTELMATPEQREEIYHTIRKFRNEKPIFTIDFWNDSEYVHGCIAGGRNYLHINANGDVEPCAFIHYSDANIREVSLLDALTNPLFRAYRDGQPFNDNLLRPCPLLDNKDRLADMVHASGAKSTDLLNPENVDDLCAKCHDTADMWAETSGKLWEKTLRERKEKVHAR